jgi:hypothetical protein
MGCECYEFQQERSKKLWRTSAKKERIKKECWIGTERKGRGGGFQVNSIFN